MTHEDEELHRAVLDAIERPGVLDVHFQPIVDLARGVVAGYEALARFSGPPDRSPDRWFAAAHRAGVGAQLEARALASALEARAWLPPNAFLSVNVGPDALLNPVVQDVLRGAGDLRGVLLELTEQQPIDDYALVERALAPVREAGAMLAIDDAGAGFASLRHITILRPDVVKVDRDLVAHVDTDATKAAAVETLGIFASRLDAWLLTEGLETPSELERISALGVPLGQGYLLGRPSPAMQGVTTQANMAHRWGEEHPALHGELADLGEIAPMVRRSAPSADVAAAFARSTAHDWVTLVDEFCRPVVLLAREAGRRVPALVAGHVDRPTDVLRRALTRTPEDRFAPIALCDDLGRFRSLLRIERLLERVATLADGRSAAASA